MIGTIILTTALIGPSSQVSQQHADTPYTATVAGTEARFVFPLPHQDRWEFGGPADHETTEFEWSVEVENDGSRYTFGIYVTRSPDGHRGTSQQPAAFFGKGRVSVDRGGVLEPVSDAYVYTRPGGWPEAQDYDRFALTISEPRTLRTLFYRRPKQARFREVYPGQPAVTHDVPITYTDYAFEAPAPVQEPAWTKSNAATVGSIAIAPGSRCLAVADATGVDVLDTDARELWRWDFARTNRFITAGPLAVTPACDAVALAGNPGYRYTWIATRGGRHVAVRTSSTPLGVGFDRSGGLLAIGTAGKDVLLYGIDGALKWKRTLEDWCCVVEQLWFSTGNDAILIGSWGIGALRKDGTVIWTSSENAMAASSDGRTFAAWAQPNHGPGIGYVTLLGEDGKPLWRRLSSTADVAISASGDRLVARINDNQSPSQEEWLRAWEQKDALQILRRDGSVETTLPSRDGTPIAISPDERLVLVRTPLGIEAIRTDGARTFEIPFERNTYPRIAVSDDFSGLAILSAGGSGALRWYRLPR